MVVVYLIILLLSTAFLRKSFIVDNISTVIYNDIKVRRTYDMHKEDLQKEWKKILIDAGISETEFFKSRGINQQSGNRKIREGTIKHIEYVNYLNALGYDVQIIKQDKNK